MTLLLKVLSAIFCALRPVVLGALDGHEHGTVAAGQQCRRALAWPRERGVQLHGVEHAEPPAGTGADVDDAAAGAQPRHGSVDGTRQLRRGGTHRQRRLRLVGDEGLDQRRGVVAVELRVVGMRLLGA